MMSLSEVIEIGEYEAFYRCLDRKMTLEQALIKVGKIADKNFTASDWERKMEDRRANERD